MERRFLGLVTIGDEAAEEIDEEVDGAAMAGVLNLRNVLELVEDGFDNGAFAQQEFIRPQEEARFHPPLDRGQQVHAERGQELLGQGRRDIPFVGKELPKEGLCEFGDGLAVIGIARGEGHPQQLAAIIDDEVELEAKEPADRGFAACGQAFKDFMLGDPAIMAYGQRRGVDEGGAGIRPIALAQIGAQRP